MSEPGDHAAWPELIIRRTVLVRMTLPSRCAPKSVPWRRMRALAILPERLRRLPPRKATPIGAHALFESTKSLAGNDVIFMAIEDAGGDRRLHFGDDGDLLHHHTLRFALRDCTACRQSNHAQCNDALGLDTQLDRFKRDVEPRIEQRNTECGGEEKRGEYNAY